MLSLLVGQNLDRFEDENHPYMVMLSSMVARYADVAELEKEVSLLTNTDLLTIFKLFKAFLCPVGSPTDHEVFYLMIVGDCHAILSKAVGRSSSVKKMSYLDGLSSYRSAKSLANKLLAPTSELSLIVEAVFSSFIEEEFNTEWEAGDPEKMEPIDNVIFRHLASFVIFKDQILIPERRHFGDLKIELADILNKMRGLSVGKKKNEALKEVEDDYHAIDDFKLGKLAHHIFLCNLEIKVMTNLLRGSCSPILVSSSEEADVLMALKRRMFSWH